MTQPLAFLFDRCFPRPIARMIEQYEGENCLIRFQDDDNRFAIDSPDTFIIEPSDQTKTIDGCS